MLKGDISMEQEEQNINSNTEEIEEITSGGSDENSQSSENIQSKRIYTPAEQAYIDANVGVHEKKPSLIVTFFNNLKYRLSYTPALIFTFVVSLISLIGLLFFIGQREVFINDPEVVTACFLMIVVFSVFLALFAVLFIISVILNIIRYRQGKR